MNANQLAQTLGVTRRQITAWKKQGLPFRRIGRRDDYDPEAIALWLAVHGLHPRGRVVETVDQVAEHCGVHRRTVHEWLRQHCPGKPGTYDLDAIAAWRDARSRAAKEEDGALAGPASPGLERYRLARAAIAELELEQLRGRLVPRDEVHAVMDQVAGVLRNAGEVLQRHYGDEARQVLEEAIDNARRLLEGVRDEGFRDLGN